MTVSYFLFQKIFSWTYWMNKTLLEQNYYSRWGGNSRMSHMEGKDWEKAYKRIKAKHLTAGWTPALWVVKEKDNILSLFHEFVMLILEDFGRRLGVVEQLVDFLYLLPLHILFSLNTAQQAGWSQQLGSVPERKQEVTVWSHMHIQYKPLQGEVAGPKCTILKIMCDT